MGRTMKSKKLNDKIISGMNIWKAVNMHNRKL